MAATNLAKLAERLNEINGQFVPAARAVPSKDPGDYLVVEDPKQTSTFHLQVSEGGKPNHKLMGAAYAALTSTHRGKPYSGPNKAEALAKLKKLYASEKMDLPASKSITVNVFEGGEFTTAGGTVANAAATWNGHEWVSKPKAGARHSAKDQDHLDQAADHLMQAGANVPKGKGGAQNLNANGTGETTEAKALAEEMAECIAANPLRAVPEASNADQLVVENYIILFGGRDLSGFKFVGDTQPTYINPDGSHGTRFAPNVEVESSYTKMGRFPVDWEHGLTDEAGRDDLYGYVDWSTKRVDDKGVFVRRVLDRHKNYVQWLDELLPLGIFGTSSEAIPEGIKALEDGTIVAWPLKRDAITITPAEPRMLSENQLRAFRALKQVIPSGSGRQPDGSPTAPGLDSPAPAANSTAQASQTEELSMDQIAEIKALADKLAAVQTGREEDQKTIKALTAKLDELLRQPALHTEPAQVKAAEAERPFRTVAEQCFAVRDLALRQVTETQVNKLEAVRSNWMSAMKASGSNENIGSEGGWVLQHDFASDIFYRTYSTGAVLSRCAVQEIGAGFTGTKIPAVDEQSRADGSRFGGIQAYWLAEAQSAVKSKPTFRQVVLELKKLFAVVYGTDELLADSTAFQSFLMRVLPMELNFKLEDAVINGAGGGQPLGITNAQCNATIAIAKESGQATKTIVFQNIVKMWAAMWAGGQGGQIVTGAGGGPQGNGGAAGNSLAGACWFVNQDTIPQLFQLSLPVGVGGYPLYIPPGALNQSPYGTMFGKPVIPIEQCQTLGTQGDIILADLSQYALATKGGVNAQQSIHVQFLTDETTFRWTYRADGQPLWNTALTPKNGTNKQSPFVVLATR